MQPLNCFYTAQSNKDGVRAECKKCVGISSTEYNLENPEVHKKSSRKYRLANPEKVKAANLKWYLSNPEKVRHNENARRAKKLSNGVFKITSKELKKLYQSPCIYCGSRDSIHADHVIPIAKGGVHSIGNLVPACRKCNQSKGSKLLTEWKASLKWAI